MKEIEANIRINNKEYSTRLEIPDDNRGLTHKIDELLLSIRHTIDNALQFEPKEGQ